MNLALDIIRRETEKGPISFARFMEIALYAPEVGYYEQQKEIGRKGDFYTSVSVGPLFGELLAFQMAEWLRGLAQTGTSRLQIVEAGAHNGQLAEDILRALQQSHADVYHNVEYWILEPSAIHRDWQQQRLAGFSNKVTWHASWESLGGRKVSGIIFSNELLDAMPVHRLLWNSERRAWQELKVAWTNNEFAWTSEEIDQQQGLPTPMIPSSLIEILPDGFTTEVSPIAINWWKEAANTLHAGKLLAIDYGLREEDFFESHRSDGTVRAYSRHKLSNNLLAAPGQQDITAHVNFSAVQLAGEVAGLTTSGFVSQSKFLTEIAAQMWRFPERFPWDKNRTRQFQTLTHPEHLGHTFSVLVQER